MGYSPWGHKELDMKIQFSSVAQSCLTSLQPYGLYPARVLCPWDSPGKNTGVGCQSFLQGNLPDPGIKPGSPALQVDSLPAEPP